jgi:hypothetical protein
MDDELPEALGYLRQAAHQLLSDPDPTGRALRLAAQVLDLQELLGAPSLEPVFTPGTSSAVHSLLAASRLMSQVARVVPSEVWPALQILLAEAGDYGQR